MLRSWVTHNSTDIWCPFCHLSQRGERQSVNRRHDCRCVRPARTHHELFKMLTVIGCHSDWGEARGGCSLRHLIVSVREGEKQGDKQRQRVAQEQWRRAFCSEWCFCPGSEAVLFWGLQTYSFLSSHTTLSHADCSYRMMLQSIHMWGRCLWEGQCAVTSWTLCLDAGGSDRLRDTAGLARGPSMPW